MKLKKILSVIFAIALIVSAFAGCANNKNDDNTTNNSTSNSADAAAKSHIYVLTAAEDHGWTGSVATFAKEKAKEINDEGKYSAEVITCADANDQIKKVEDIAAKNEKNIGVVIMPIDDTVQSAIQRLIDDEIPFVAFDRIIEAVSSSAISNVKGDNTGIGAGAAAYFVENGLKPGDKIYVYEGDTSSVTSLRNKGFTDYLKGEIEFESKKIDDDKKWTDDDIKKITYSGAMNWSRSDTKTSFETLMGNSKNAEIKWFYAQDDELAMGILEALQGGGIADSTKKAFLNNKPFITGCGGLNELYEVLRGNTYKEISGQLGGLMSVTFSPSLIQTAIQDMVDSFEGKDVEKDHVIECKNVTSENVADFKAFD